MEDDHVDRPGVQARQRVELTGTNRSIGLIALMVHVRGRVRKDRFACRCDLKGAIPEALSPETLPSVALSLAGPVTGARRPKHDPISNSAVKRLSADGTVSQDPGE